MLSQVAIQAESLRHKYRIGMGFLTFVLFHFIPQVAIQAESLGLVAKLPRGTALPQYVRSVLLFMETNAEEHAARTQTTGAAKVRMHC